MSGAALALAFSEDADLDLFDIAQYGARRFGRSQASRFVAELQRALDAVAPFPSLERIYDGRGGSEVRR